MEEINGLMPEGNVEYTEDNIRHLDDMEHIRVRSGMYIGRLGDGTQNDDGIYVLLKEVMDNSIDEFKMGAGRRIEINIEDNLRVSVRDYGRGIPQGKLIEAVSKLNTGGKYDSKAFKKSVGLNGVGIKAVNALSSRFEVRSYREGKVRIACLSFEQGLNNSFYLSEEVLSTYSYKKIIKVNDRATALNLMVGMNAYTLCSGIICEELNGSDYSAVPLDSDEKMTIGYVTRKGINLSKLGNRYIEELKKYRDNVM